MCKAVEEYAKEYAKLYAKEIEEKSRIEKSVEVVKNMLKDGFSIDKALKYADIDRSTYDKYVGQVQ